MKPVVAIAGFIAVGSFVLLSKVANTRVANRDEFDPLIFAAASRHPNVTPSLIKAVIAQESNFNPNAKAGTTSATGLMQVTVAVVSDYNDVFEARLNHSTAMLIPRLNIEVGTWYLSQQVTRFGQFGGLRAYFAGPSGFTRGLRAQESFNYATEVSLKEVAILQATRGKVA